MASAPDRARTSLALDSECVHPTNTVDPDAQTVSHTNRLIRLPVWPRTPGEGSDALRHFHHELVPSVLACIEDGLVGVPDAVAEKVGPAGTPRRFPRSSIRAHRVAGAAARCCPHLQLRRAVPARAVQHQQSDGTHRDASADFGQMRVHRVDVNLRHDDCGAGAALRADRSEQIGPFVASVARGAGA